MAKWILRTSYLVILRIMESSRQFDSILTFVFDFYVLELSCTVNQ